MDYKPYIHEDQLQKSFGFCMDLDKKYKVYLCLYSTHEFIIEYVSNKEMMRKTQPYLTFIGQESNNITFPFFEYECPIINQIHKEPQTGGEPLDIGMNAEHEPEEPEEQEKNHFETELFKQWLNIYKDTTQLHDLLPTFHQIYKGFVEHETDKLFVFIDVKTIPFQLKENMKTVVMDEIIFKKSLKKTPMDTIITQFFKSHPEFIYVKDAQDNNLSIPFQLYMCKIENGLYTKITKNDNFVYPIEHSIFGNSYIFVNENDGGSEDIRFVCHINNCYYLLEEINEMATDKMVKSKDMSSISSCVYFHENDRQMWIIRNINAIHKLDV